MTRIPGLALVLSGGGARSSYQAGVLAYIAERIPDLEIPILTGVSAGAINIAYLASHQGTFRERVAALQGQWLQLFADNVYGLPPTGLARSLWRLGVSTLFHRHGGPPSIRGLVDTDPLARFLARGMDFGGIRENVASGRLRAVAFTATSYSTGRTVSFFDADPDVQPWERAQRIAERTTIGLKHVMASAALPIVFPAVKINDAFYGDGSVRQTAPLSPAVHLGATRILAIAGRPMRQLPTTSDGAAYPTAAQVMGLLFHTIFLDSLDADAERLENMNRLIAAFPPGTPVPGNLRRVNLLMIRPSQDLSEMARGYHYRLPWYVWLVVRSMGGQQDSAADFLSYLLFDPEYTGHLMELGYDDAKAQWEKIEGFLTVQD